VDGKHYHRDSECVFECEESGEWHLVENGVGLACGKVVHDDVACYCEEEDVYVLHSEAVYSKYHGSNLVKIDAVYSDHEDDWYLDQVVVDAIVDECGHTDDVLEENTVTLPNGKVVHDDVADYYEAQEDMFE